MLLCIGTQMLDSAHVCGAFDAAFEHDEAQIAKQWLA
jgi:hypothetical protein